MGACRASISRRHATAQLATTSVNELGHPVTEY